MNTFQFSTNTFVVFDGVTNEYHFGPGTWQLADVVQVAVGTNAGVNVEELTTGYTVAVDVVGEVWVTEPPMLSLAVISGFALGLSTVGVMWVIRWMAGQFVRTEGSRGIE